jgi:hypothetical protein
MVGAIVPAVGVAVTATEVAELERELTAGLTGAPVGAFEHPQASVSHRQTGNAVFLENMVEEPSLESRHVHARAYNIALIEYGRRLTSGGILVTMWIRCYTGQEAVSLCRGNSPSK